MPDDTGRSSLTRRMCDGLALEIRRPRLRPPRACRQSVTVSAQAHQCARVLNIPKSRRNVKKSKKKHFPRFSMKTHTKQLSNHEIKQQIYPFAN